VNSDLRVVAANPEDLETYVDLLEEAAEWLESRGVGMVQPGTYRRFGHYFGASIAAQEVYLALVDGDLVGSFRLTNDGGPVWPGATDEALYLENLVVRRTFRGRGIGRDLLLVAERKASNAGKRYLRLDCFANNSVLRTYYEMAGYDACGEIEADYPFGKLRLYRYQKAV
jgi:GNAT superfamily N-acetyltransferase